MENTKYTHEKGHFDGKFKIGIFFPLLLDFVNTF